MGWIKAYILKNYGSGLAIVEDKAKFILRKIQTDEGVRVEKLMFLKKLRRHIPASKIDKVINIKDAPQIIFYMIDDYTIYPVIPYNSKLEVVDPETGKKVKIFDGNVLVDSKGNKVELRQLLAQKTYDAIEFLSSEVMSASRMFSTSGLSKYASPILMFLIMVVGSSFIFVMSTDLGKSLNEASKSLGPSLEATAMYNYNTSKMLWDITWMQCQMSGRCNLSALPPTPQKPPY